MKVKEDQLDHFLTFITSPHVVQDLRALACSLITQIVPVDLKYCRHHLFEFECKKRFVFG